MPNKSTFPLRRSPVFFWALLSLVSLTSLASPGWALAKTCDTGNAAQQMACLKMGNDILTERLARATLLKSISKQSATTVKSARKLGFPSVLSTYGINGHMNAVLVWKYQGRNMGNMITHDGSVIPGGWHIAQIDNGTVIIRKGARSQTLLLSSGSSTSNTLSLPGSVREAGAGMSGIGGVLPVTGASPLQGATPLQGASPAMTGTPVSGSATEASGTQNSTTTRQ